MSLVFVDAVQGRSLQRSIQTAAKRFPNGFAAVLRRAKQRWLLYSAEHVSLRAAHCFENSPERQGIALTLVGTLYNLCAWQDNKLRLYFWGEEHQCQFLLHQLAANPNFKPALYLAENVSGGLAQDVRKLWSTGISAWPNSTNKKRVATMMPVRRLNARGPLLVLVLLGLLGVLWYGYSSYSAAKNAAAITPEVSQIYQQIASSRAQPTPLFKLDYQVQSLLQRVYGWEVDQVEFSPNRVQYRLQQDGGLNGELRNFANAHGFLLSFQNNRAVLSRSIQLPDSVNNPDQLNWHSVTELSDWLDERLRLWLPDFRVQVGARQSEQGWQSQPLMIEFQNVYSSDLLTLAGILSELPVALEGLDYRRQGEQITGLLRLTAFGREPE